MSEKTISQAVQAEDGILVRYLVIAEVIAPDGTESIRWRSSEGMADWTALGLVEWCAARLRGYSMAAGVEDEEDE